MIKRRRIESQRMAAASMLAVMAGMAGAPIIEAPRVKEPRMLLTEEELEKLASFGVTKEERRAKKAYVKELEIKYKQA